jgi:hypothetical protein
MVCRSNIVFPQKYLRSFSSLGFFAFLIFSIQSAWALRPLSSYSLDLVAGEGGAGFQDGSFTHARFNRPQNLVYLPGDRLAVNDFGNKLVRLIDLKTGMVSTLAGGPSATLAEGPASQVSMAGIRDMAYLGAADFLFLTDPDKFAVRRLELKTGRVTLIPRSQLGPFHPAALCAAENTLYIGEKEQPSVFALEWKPDAPVTAIPLLTSKSFVLSLAEIHGFLYALQNSPDYPLQRLLPATQTDPITFLTAWGDEVPQPGQNLYPFNNLTASKPGGFVCDPNNEHKLYFTNPLLNSVLSYRDLFGFPMRGGDGRTANGLSEPLYPLQKPAHTFRILYVGDSRSCMVVGHPFKGTATSAEPADGWPRILNTAKRLELELNTLAAMEDQPLNFEVFNVFHSAGDPLFLWPNYEVPEIAQKNDIDLVVILQPPAVYTVYPFLFYFKCPPTKEGIPYWPWDMEYRLKPPEKRIPDGEAREFYELCKKEHLIKMQENDKENNFLFDDSLFSKPEFHDVLVRMYGKPLDLLNRKLAGIKTSGGKPVRLLLCTTYTGVLRPNPEDPKIWEDVCKRYGVSYMDTNDEMTAFRLAYYPLSENGGNDHLTPEGNLFFSELLAHDLIRDGLIPWVSRATPPASPAGEPTAVPTPSAGR